MHDSLFEVSKLHTTCTLVYSLKWLVWVKEVKGKHSMAISVILGESRVLLQLVRTKVSFFFFKFVTPSAVHYITKLLLNLLSNIT